MNLLPGFGGAVAVGHEPCPHPDGRVDPGTKVGNGRLLTLEQQDAAARTDRRDHVQVKRDLSGPAGIGGRKRSGVTALVNFLETSTAAGAGGQAVGGAVSRQVRLG